MLHPAASAPHWDGLFGVIASRWQAASGDAPQELTDDSRRLKFVFREYCFCTAALLLRPTGSANAFRADDYWLAELFSECLDFERGGRSTAHLAGKKI